MRPMDDDALRKRFLALPNAMTEPLRIIARAWVRQLILHTLERLPCI